MKEMKSQQVGLTSNLLNSYMETNYLKQFHLFFKLLISSIRNRSFSHQRSLCAVSAVPFMEPAQINLRFCKINQRSLFCKMLPRMNVLIPCSSKQTAGMCPSSSAMLFLGLAIGNWLLEQSRPVSC